MFVGIGFIRSETHDNHRGVLDGIISVFGAFPYLTNRFEACGMHKCIPYEIVDVYLMIQTWVFIEPGGTDKSVPYEHDESTSLISESTIYSSLKSRLF